MPPATTIPGSVAQRIADPEDRRALLAEGPVKPADTASVVIQLADLSARAMLHGQLSLASTLSAALGACEALERPGVILGVG